MLNMAMELGIRSLLVMLIDYYNYIVIILLKSNNSFEEIYAKDLNRFTFYVKLIDDRRET